LAGETPKLPFAPSEAKDESVAKTIHPGVPEYVDLFAITDDNNVLLALYEGRGPSSVNWPDMFMLAGDYLIEVAVVCPNAPSVRTKLLFRWPLQRNSVEVLWLTAEN
jgi:hypothetical protein